jgi:hypothetical protein
MVSGLLQAIEDTISSATATTKCSLRESDLCTGIELLAFGNNNYSLLGLENGGKLKNAVGDAKAIAEAFRNLGANANIVLDVEDLPNLEKVLDDWADMRIVSDVRVVFVFWSGHAFQSRSDGTTHLVPTGKNWDIKRIQPGRETCSVKHII